MKYRVVVDIRKWVALEVEGADLGEVHAAARKAAEEDTAPFTYSTSLKTQIGEPWVYSRGWYDVNSRDIVFIERATGNVFTAEDIAVLRRRLEQIGLCVRECWNGDGCDQVSFRCSRRKGVKPMSTKHLAILLAPRSVG